MSETPGNCASCGRTPDQARFLVAIGRVHLCGECVRLAEESLVRAVEEETLRRAGGSQSVMAEELALNLMDALDASRTGGGFDWSAVEGAREERSARQDDVPQQPEDAPSGQPDGAPSDQLVKAEAAQPDDAASLPPDSDDPGHSEAPAPRDPEPLPRVLKVAAVIPARYGSSRFPGKPLHLIAGRPMIQHVWERCVQSGAFAEVLIATDDERIAEAVRAFGGVAVMTSPYAKSGTDRVAEIAKAREDLTHFVNVQGDEPLIHAEMLTAVAGTFEDPEVEIATLVRPLDEDERHNANVVKVVLARNYDALYFSRADVPFLRDEGTGFPHRYAHIGLYGYSREALLDIARHPPSPLEETEKLEQLRALELGLHIRCLVTLHRSIGVDTPEDALRVEAMLAAESQSPPGPS